MFRGEQKNGKSEYFLATVVWKGGGVDELNEPRPSMQWRFDPDHPPTNSDPATSCNLVIVGIVMRTMMVKIVTMMMNWWWWWTVLMVIHQATIGVYHPSKYYDFMIMGILMYQGCNKCLPGWFWAPFQKAPLLANYFLSDPTPIIALPDQSLSHWPCWILFEMLKLNSQKLSRSHAS